MIHILADMITMRVNGVNDRPMAVEALAEFPHQYYRPPEESLQDATINTLLEIGLTKHAEEYLAYRSIKGLLREGELTISQLPYFGFKSKKQRNEIEQFYKSLGCDTIEGINDLLREGKPFTNMVKAFNERAAKQNEDVVDSFLGKEGVKAVIIAGPSSSGKSTTTKKLIQSSGMPFKSLTVDMYFKSDQPKNPHGDTLYELPESLDLNLLYQHLQQLKAGKEIITPLYDFDKGIRLDEPGPPLKLNNGEILLIDSHAGLFPTIRESFSKDERFIVYTQPFPMIKYGDGSSGEFISGSYDNMLRRWLRDSRTRGTSFEFNIPHWRTAELGAQRDIRSRMGHADIVVDTSTAYDFHFLGAAYEKQDTFWNLDPQKFIEDGQLYAAIALSKAREILNSVEKPSSYYHRKDILSNDAVLREFIGGSDLNIK